MILLDFALTFATQSDIFIVVVGEITVTEQTEIFMMGRDLEESRKVFKKVIVVHNFRETRALEDFVFKVDRIKRLYEGCSVKHEEVDWDGKTETIEYLDGIKSPVQEGLEYQWHFWIGKV